MNTDPDSNKLKTLDRGFVVRKSTAKQREQSKIRLVLLYTLRQVNAFPNDKFSDSSKLKAFADDNFKFDENGRKLFLRVENTRYEQFLLFPQCFQKTCSADT